MSDDRRYDDDEVREIFALAIEGSDGQRPEGAETGRLTLEELQDVGLEVGVAPERIAEAATALDRRRGVLPQAKHLGMPVSVGRTVELPREPTDQEWNRLVAEFRSVFGATGSVGSHGGLRAWSNGNLRAVLEAGPGGDRLRLETRKGGAVATNLIGVGLVSISVLLVVAELIATALGSSVLTGGLLDLQGSILPLLLAALGGVALGSNAFTLPEWAHEREGQMEYLADRVKTIVPPEEPTDSDPAR